MLVRCVDYVFQKDAYSNVVRPKPGVSILNRKRLGHSLSLVRLSLPPRIDGNVFPDVCTARLSDSKLSRHQKRLIRWEGKSQSCARAGKPAYSTRSCASANSLSSRCI